MAKLTDKQEAFCREYVVDYNATQAAIRAGYSKKTANEQGAQNLAKLSIQKRVEQLKSNILEKVEIRAEDVALSDRDVIEVTWEELHNWDGYVATAKPPEELTDRQKRAIKGLTQTGKYFTYVLHDVDKAKERLMKYSGGYEKDNKHKLDVNVLSGFDKWFMGLDDDQRRDIGGNGEPKRDSKE